MYFQVYQDVNREWRLRLRGANHEIIITTEGYKTKASCLHALSLVKQAYNAPVYDA